MQGDKDTDVKSEEVEKEEDELIIQTDETQDNDGKENKASKKKDETKHDEVTPDQAIEELRAKLAEREASERQQRDRADAAESKAQEYEQEAQRVKSNLFDKEFQVADAAIDSAKRESASAKQAAALAFEAGDYKAGLEHQERMSLAAAQLVQVENYRARLEARKEQLEAQAEEEAKKPKKQERQLSQDEQFDSFLQTRTPKSAAWLREHRKEALDPVTWNLIVAADQEARRKGYQADSDDYFEHIESRLDGWSGSRTVEADEDAPKSKKPSYNAPPSRGSSSNRAEQNTVKLTKEMREMAWNLRPDLSKAEAERVYARNKLAIEREKESLH